MLMDAAVQMEWMNILSNPIVLLGMNGATCNAMETGKSTWDLSSLALQQCLTGQVPQGG